MIYLDSESVGLIGPTVLWQWARDDGPIHLHHVFDRPVRDTLRLLESFVEDDVCIFNATHDWFHAVRMYNVFRRLDPDKTPTVAGWFENLRPAVREPLCLKPRSCLDLMLHARKGPMQSLMDRDDIYVRRVPKVLAEPLAEVLTEQLDLPSIYFARLKQGATWRVQQEPDDPEFPHVYLSFGASSGLKALAAHVLGVETIEFPIPGDYLPKQESWDHFRVLPDWMVRYHIAFWRQAEPLRYAIQDVELLRRLRAVWNNPPPGDDDSELAICVGACRWAGWSIDEPLLQERLDVARREMDAAPRDYHQVLPQLRKLAGPTMSIAIDDTAAETLEAIVKLCPDEPVGLFAQRVIDARSAEKLKDILEKVDATGRAHFDFKVTGARSGRMAGAGGINPQGIPSGVTRNIFTLADADEDLEGGDAAGFEVTIAAAVYNDAALIADLEAGKKVHAMLGADMYDADPDYVKLTDKSRGEKQVKDPSGRGWEGDLYNPAKHMVFTLIYGGSDHKVASTGRLELEDAQAGLRRFFDRYPDVERGMKRDEAAFCSMSQPNGPGTRVIWRDPADYAESLLGFRRDFTLENRLCKLLFDNGNKPDRRLDIKGVAVKRDLVGGRIQTPGGAVRSALYGAAFQIQGRNMRAARNHRIQSTGAGITKGLQRAVWDHQPVGIHLFVVRPINVHDEVLSPTRGVRLEGTVERVVERYREVVPLLKWEWVVGAPHWGGIKK